MRLELPFLVHQAALRLRQTGGRREIYDPVRRKYFLLQPEEWVRQLVLQYLMAERRYPLGKMRVEAGLTLNGLQKRCDILVYDAQFQPYLLVECKAAHIPLSQAAFDQVARYNLVYRVPYLMVTNGRDTYICEIFRDTEGYRFLEAVPFFPH